MAKVKQSDTKILTIARFFFLFLPGSIGTREYVLQLAVEHIALPDMLEKLVMAAIASDIMSA
ncbi:MAG: hypothetical protein HWQ41_18945 [Nostoc sp. NOS(2021)]|uniref:hypothetical protein n=1 Tax=Nostoc sp. NOS(2021) TaxID=2815407 RepID=UPI0025E0AC9A|nr:hypothetical protein [Nostoc sp. NOS(2021)]MBN3897272.1 hypothetical protein [Nostoc sp. NOS(2021)]